MHRVLGGIAFLWGLFPGFAVASEGGGFINLDRSLLIQVVNFLLLLLLLWRFAYRPFLGKLDERSQTIKKALADAEAARTEAERRREEQQAKLRAAYQEAQSIREAALKEAAEEQRRLIDGARAEALRMVAAARAQIEQDVRRAREELQREVADLAVAVAERLIRKSLRDPDHLRIVGEAIEGLERSR